MMNVQDYRLVDLYNTSEDDFDTYLEAWLLYSINEFSMCSQDLTFNTTTDVFSVDLTQQNKLILAKLMMKYWLQREVNNITQMNLHITDRDFKIASEAQNLREKVKYLNIVKEDCAQMLNEYEYKNNSWDDWFNQSFKGD
jgi:hypothetical protein